MQLRMSVTRYAKVSEILKKKNVLNKAISRTIVMETVHHKSSGFTRVVESGFALDYDIYWLISF